MTPQEKIDEIHSILVKWENRRKRRLIFTWGYRFIILGFFVMVLLNPQIITELTQRVFTPIINNLTQQILESQKQNISEFSQNFSQTAKNLWEWK